MVEIVSLLGGALVRLLTWGSEYFTKKQENSHELVLLARQIELEKVRGQEKRAEIVVQGEADVETEWAKALGSALTTASAPTGNCYIDFINSTVRPALTYWWCVILYTVSKGFLIYAAVKDELSAKEMAGVITTEFDRAVVGSILGFWFADRALRKFSGK